MLSKLFILIIFVFLILLFISSNFLLFLQNSIDVHDIIIVINLFILIFFVAISLALALLTSLSNNLIFIHRFIVILLLSTASLRWFIWTFGSNRFTFVLCSIGLRSFNLFENLTHQKCDKLVSEYFHDVLKR